MCEVLLTNLRALQVLDISDCASVTGSCFYARDSELGSFKPEALRRIYHSVPLFVEN